MLLGFGLGGWEIAIIFLIVVLVFGPSKLPQLGSSIGKMLGGFKKEMKAIEDEKQAEGDDSTEAHRDELDVTPSASRND